MIWTELELREQCKGGNEYKQNICMCMCVLNIPTFFRDVVGESSF